MKFLLIFTLVGVAVSQAPHTRTLPADELRDFKGSCFASTQCKLYKVAESWSLFPFCGKATCTQDKNTGQLLEVVEDCGLLPKPNPQCQITNRQDQNATFPTCCPKFECEPGVQLEYPTAEELQALRNPSAPTPQ